MLSKHRKRGFTLVEMAISITILTLATMAIATMLIFGMRGYSTGTTSDSVTDYTTIALQKLSTDVRDGCSASDSGGSSTSSNTLTVTFPALLTDSTTGQKYYDLSSSNKSTRTYYISNGNLVRKTSTSVTVIGKGVGWAHFYASSGSITVDLSATQNSGPKTVTLQVNQRISLRNYQN